MPKIDPPKLFTCNNTEFAQDKNNDSKEKTLFEKAVAESYTLPIKPSNEIMLQLYSLYKQATEGDINIAPPNNPFDFIAKAKFEAWASHKGKTIPEARTAYISLVNKLKT